jgi:leucyl/phenylalanyl-tRNA---protein transferase
MSVFLLNERMDFPNPESADPSGLLAIGGDLLPIHIERAYRMGIFPWYNFGEPVQWWSPDPRMVMFPEKLKISKSMKQILRKNRFHWTFDKAFAEVIDACSGQPRKGQDGTWITAEMKIAYTSLYESGIAHSVEVWENDSMVGGLYGLLIGTVFFGESMFSKQSNASKFGFINWVAHLQERGLKLVDCQVYTAHMESLGAETVSRKKFVQLLNLYTVESNLKL